MNQCANPVDPFKPAGCRLLVQLIEEDNEKAARDTLIRMFGTRKGMAALLVAGTMQPNCKTDWGGKQWFKKTVGFRAYLPSRWK